MKGPDIKSNDDLDISVLLKIILRNKKIIFIISLLSFISGSLISFIPKKIWVGDLQIIKSNNSLCNIQLDDYTGLDLLKSEKVLKNIYKEIKLEKTDKSEIIKLPKFSEWSNQFNIDFLRGTRIINISYKDQNKKDILPILKRIPLNYESYIKKETEKCLLIEKTTLKNQLLKAEEYFDKSSIKLLNFVKSNNLTFVKFKRTDEMSMTTLMLLEENERKKISPSILLKYEFLLENYSNNKNQLQDLKKQYFNKEVALLSNKNKNVIEILKEPQLKENPIYPEKRKIAFLALLIGLIVSSFIVIWKEADNFNEINISK